MTVDFLAGAVLSLMALIVGELFLILRSLGSVETAIEDVKRRLNKMEEHYGL